MDVYVVLPTFGPHLSADAVLESARLSEELGFAGVASTDHMFVPPGPEGQPDRYEQVYDVLAVLGAVASTTRRLKLMTSVVVLPMRNPFVVAKQAATLDQFSGGRLILGLGAGYREEEFVNVGADFRTRGRRLDEGIRLIRHLFGGSRQPFASAYYPYESGVFGPLPVQGDSLPILIGGNSDAALRRAASSGDMWQCNPYITPEQFPERVRRLNDLAGDRRVSPGARIHLSNDVADMRSQSFAYAEAGAEHLTIEFYPFEGLSGRIRSYADHVLPTLIELAPERVS